MTKNTLLHIHKPTIHIVTTIVVYAAVLYALWVLRSVCLGALLGFIGYAILYQPFHWIKQWTSSRALAFVSSFLALIVFLGVCVGVIVYIAFDLGLQARSVLGSIQTIIPEQVTSFLSTYDIQSVITYVQDNLGSIRSSFGQIVSSIGQFFSVLSFSVVFVFVFLAEPRWIGKLGRWLNTTTRRDVVGLTLETRSLLYVWFWQQAKVGLIVAGIVLVYMIGLRIVAGEDVGNIWVISSLGFLGEFFPLVGPVIGWIPVGAASFGISMTAGLVSVVYFIGIQILEGYVLIPRLVGDKLRMPTTWSIVLLIIGGSLFGILGIILSLPLGSLLYKKFRDTRDS